MDRGLWLSQSLNQPVHLHEIPAVRDHSVFEIQEGRAGQGGFLCARGKAKVMAEVGHGGGPTHSDPVAFANNVVEHEMEIGESAAERCMNRFEVTGPYEYRVGFGETVRSTVWGKHLVNDRAVPLVPDLVEPTLGELPVCFGHGNHLQLSRKHSIGAVGCTHEMLMTRARPKWRRS